MMIGLERTLSATRQELLDDQALLKRIAKGDEDALRWLVDCYGQRLYAYALRLTGSPTAAEEAVQESLVAVWQGAGRYRGEGRAVAWLLRIVHHKALNSMRGRPVDSLDEKQDEVAAAEPLPDELVSRGDQQRMLKDGLAKLSPDHRAALELVFYQGLSLEEAASVLACPVGTVKSRLNYAKTALRGALSRAGMTAEDLP
jgi:RNA polymerase sigma-70 factor (ECF subfamily)